jgi:cell division septation protein DedD
MAPLLLDRRSLIKSGFYLFLLLTVVFFGGYYSGYTKGYGHAESLLQQNTLPPVALVLPEPAYADSAVFEPQPPAVIEPGADIDVDRPDAAIAEADTSTSEAAEKATSGDEPHTASPSPPVQLASLEVTPAIVADANAATQSPAHKIGDVAVSALTSNASVTDARFSIQVGMYGSVNNAEVLLETLNASSLDAYIDEFSNAKGEPRFNVRFGFYRDRASAKAALRAYRSTLAGEGYVVRVSD